MKRLEIVLKLFKVYWNILSFQLIKSKFYFMEYIQMSYRKWIKNVL